MSALVDVASLAAHRDLVPLVARWFECEWPAYYGPGGPGDAAHDAAALATPGPLPVGFVALQQGTPLGVAALNCESIASHRHLTPWAAAGFVQPGMRGRGIGARLLAAVEDEARARNCPAVYCATASAVRLLERCGWSMLERVVHDGAPLGVFRKSLYRPLVAATCVAGRTESCS